MTPLLIVRFFIVGYSTSLVILVASFFRRDPKKRRLDFWIAAGATIYSAAGCALLSHTATQTWDAAFLRADLSLGLNPFGFAHLVARSPELSILLLGVYYALPWVVGLVWVLEQDSVLLRAFAIASVLCFAFYFLFPAVGPGHFDWVSQKPINGAPDNCMPSMHFAWALLLAANARAPWLRYSLAAYAILIAIATIALEQHYVVDLIAALPYTVAVEWLAARGSGLTLRSRRRLLIWKVAR